MLHFRPTEAGLFSFHGIITVSMLRPSNILYSSRSILSNRETISGNIRPRSNRRSKYPTRWENFETRSNVRHASTLRLVEIHEVDSVSNSTTRRTRPYRYLILSTIRPRSTVAKFVKGFDRFHLSRDATRQRRRAR